MDSTGTSDPAAGDGPAPIHGPPPGRPDRGEAEAPDGQPGGRQSMLVRAWVAAVAQTAFVPGGRVRLRGVMDESLSRLAAALVAEPFDPAPGYQVGVDLVACRISAPRALGSTLTLLHQQLLDQLGIRHPQAQARLGALLGQLATGFVQAMNNVALAAAENISRAERAAWRDQQAALQRRLQQALLTERLTSLPNRAALVRRLGEILTEPPGCARLGLCLVNIDRFRAVNDSLGHHKGDELLRAVARRLRNLTGQTGHFLAHLGGDEFCILVEDTNGSDDMAKVADLVLRTLREPVGMDGHDIPVSASIGVVERSAADSHPAELLRAAEITLSWAKSHHRGQWAIFDPSSYSTQLRRHALAAALPTALARGEFTLAYQPLVRLADHSVAGVEALARWQHPDHGTIGPDQFIPLAEGTGLIVRLGLYLLERACSQAAAWSQRSGVPLTVSVNLGAAELRGTALPAAVMAILDRTGLPARQLQLEVTESAIASTEGTVLHALARSGVRLAIDDFGTGHSNLANLADLPVHAVKLAPRFLRGIDGISGATGGRHSNSTILPALIAMSHDLDLTVTAKGIESDAQVRQLTSLGCDLGQGLRLGHPATAEQITRLLDTRPA